MVTRRLSGTVIEIFSIEDIGVNDLVLLWSRDVTWPFESPWGVSHSWPLVTRCLSGTVIEIFSIENNGVTTFTSEVTWRHRSRDNSTPHVGFPIDGQWSPSVYLARLMRYSASKIMGSRPWPFVVTWRHLSRDHSTPHGDFPIGGQWWPGVYLAWLLRYSASKIMGSRPWP